MKNRVIYYLNFFGEGFKYRKIIHYLLLLFLIAFQVFLLILFYLEFFKKSRLEELETQMHVSEQAQYFNAITKDYFIDAQYNLQYYIQTKDLQYLKKYNVALDSLNSSMGSLLSIAGENRLFSMYLNSDKQPGFSIQNMNKRIDSLRKIEIQSVKAYDQTQWKFATYNFSDIIDSLDVTTTISIDSVQRKGLFTRLGDALSGKVDVQKEKSNVVLTLWQGQTETTGGIEEQIRELIQATDQYYQNEFVKYKKKLDAIKSQNKTVDENFFEINNELLAYSYLLLEKYNDALVAFTNDARRDFYEQYQLDKKRRSYYIIGIIVFVVGISVMLGFLTRLSFIYEKRLADANNKIQQNLNFKNKIVGMISHEIRSPLNIIAIYIKALKRKWKDPGILEPLNSIEFTTQSLDLMANQILSFSKNEHKKIELNKTKFNLTKELHEILKTLQQFVENKGNAISIRNTIPENIIVYSDVVKLHQLFYNIVGNANKYTNNGKIDVDIELKQYGTSKYKLFVEVKDNGYGIEEEDLKNIFDNYKQGENISNMKNFGAGLGLNLCKEIVLLFQGTITVFSEPNVETIVKFELEMDSDI